MIRGDMTKELHAAVDSVLQSKLRSIHEELVEEARKKFEAATAELVASVSIQLGRMLTVESFRDELIIKVKMDGFR